MGREDADKGEDDRDLTDRNPPEGGPGDERRTVDLSAVTAPQIRPEIGPDHDSDATDKTDSLATMSWSAVEDDDEPDQKSAPKQPDSPTPEPTGPATAPAAGQARRAWTALAVLLAVLLIGAAIGRFVVPAGPSSSAATPTRTASAALPPANAPPAAPSPTLVTPTAPARPADALGPWATRIGTAIGLPPVAVQAYAYAQLVSQSATPQCHLGWTTLAGIGEVSSRHGQAGGGVLDTSGRSTPAVLGPQLDGQGGRPLVLDTDAGAYDSDPVYDRAMGPLGLLPAVWKANASDGDDDQILDPYDIDDASVAAGHALCADGADLSLLTAWTAAIGRLQPGDAFAKGVFDAADSYGQRTRNVE